MGGRWEWRAGSGGVGLAGRRVVEVSSKQEDDRVEFLGESAGGWWSGVCGRGRGRGGR